MSSVQFPVPVEAPVEVPVETESVVGTNEVVGESLEGWYGGLLGGNRGFFPL
ncbi:hypothetical protein E4U27_005695, partial [Claviceps purpurea]